MRPGDAFQLLLGRDAEPHALDHAQRMTRGAPQEPCAPLWVFVRQAFPLHELLRCQQSLEAVGVRPRWVLVNSSHVAALAAADVLWRRFEVRNLRLGCAAWAAHMERWPCEPQAVLKRLTREVELTATAGMVPLRPREWRREAYSR